MSEVNKGVVAYDSIIELEDMHEKKHCGMQTRWLWILLGVLVILAILWFAFKRSHDHKSEYENKNAHEYGKLRGEIHCIEKMVCKTADYERQDALKIAYLDGALYGQRPRREEREGGCGERREHGCIHTNFKKIENFTLADTTAQQVTRCN